MKRKCIVKYALVVGVVILMYTVGVIPVINATVNSDEDDEPFQYIVKKVDEITDSDCGCTEDRNDVMKSGDVVFRPNCVRLLFYCVAIFVIGFFVPGMGTFMFWMYSGMIFKFAEDIYCPWAFLLRLLFKSEGMEWMI